MPTKDITSIDALDLILQGVKNAGSTPEEALQYLTPEDLVSLGERIAARRIRKQDLQYMEVEPINHIEQVPHLGIFDHILPKLLECQLSWTEKKKRVYFVPGLALIDNGKEEAYVNTFGVTLCKNAPNYLLGIMDKHEDIPAELVGYDIIAAGTEPGSLFKGETGDLCFMRACRYQGKRELLLIDKDGKYHSALKRVYLAEDFN